jgi:hypothetical protein
MQIVIPFAQVTALNPNLPNLGASSTLEKYFKCIAVSCHSFRSNNPDLKILLITNLSIEGETRSILEKLKVEIVITPFTFNPPVEFGDTFRGCFYFFDALRMLNEDSLIIDPDVICLGNLKDMSERLGNKIAVFTPNFHPDKLINGISPNAAVEIFKGYRSDYVNLSPKHVGGEAIFFPKESISRFKEEVTQFWDWNVLQAEIKSRFLTTEEHIITCITSKMECESLSPYISRIWTTRFYKDIEGDQQDPELLILWHLPSEKNKGFTKIYDRHIKSADNLQALKLTKQYYAKIMNLYPNFGARTLYRIARNIKT